MMLLFHPYATFSQVIVQMSYQIVENWVFAIQVLHITELMHICHVSCSDY